jgi:hypothetical protein
MQRSLVDRDAMGNATSESAALLGRSTLVSVSGHGRNASTSNVTAASQPMHSNMSHASKTSSNASMALGGAEQRHTSCGGLDRGHAANGTSAGNLLIVRDVEAEQCAAAPRSVGLCGLQLFHGATAIQGPDGSSWLRLTTTRNSLGTAWLDAKVFLRDGFETEFRFRAVGQVVAPCHDAGTAFVVQDDPRGMMAVGCSGAGLGFSADVSAQSCATHVFRSLGVELSANRLRVRRTSELTLAPSVMAQLPDGLHVDDGRAHRVRMQFTSSVSMLSVLLDDMTLPLLSTKVALQDALDVAGLGYVGFTAAYRVTPHCNRIAHEILDWQLMAFGTRTVVAEATRTAPLGQSAAG